MPASTCQPNAPYGKGAVQKSPAKEKKRQVRVIGGHGMWLDRVRWMWIELGSTLFHCKKKGQKPAPPPKNRQIRTHRIANEEKDAYLGNANIHSNAPLPKKQ